MRLTGEILTIVALGFILLALTIATMFFDSFAETLYRLLDFAVDGSGEGNSSASIVQKKIFVVIQITNLCVLSALITFVLSMYGAVTRQDRLIGAVDVVGAAGDDFSAAISELKEIKQRLGSIVRYYKNNRQYLKIIRRELDGIRESGDSAPELYITSSYSRIRQDHEFLGERNEVMSEIANFAIERRMNIHLLFVVGNADWPESKSDAEGQNDEDVELSPNFITMKNLVNELIARAEPIAKNYDSGNGLGPKILVRITREGSHDRLLLPGGRVFEHYRFGEHNSFQREGFMLESPRAYDCCLRHFQNIWNFHSKLDATALHTALAETLEKRSDNILKHIAFPDL